MPAKSRTYQTHRASRRRRRRLNELAPESTNQQTQLAASIQRARQDPRSLSHSDVIQLQGVVGNQALGRYLRKSSQSTALADSRRVDAQLGAGGTSDLAVESTRGGVVQRALDVATFDSAARAINPKLGRHKTSSLQPILDKLTADQGSWSFPKLRQLEGLIGTLRDKKATKYKGAIDQLRQEIKSEEVSVARTRGTQIADTTLYITRVTDGSDGIFDVSTGKHLVEDLTAQEKNYLEAVIGRLAKTERRKKIQISDKAGIVKSMLKDRAQMASGDLKQGPWDAAAKNIEDVVVKRVKEDIPILVQEGLITKNHQLKSIKFTGSDFHKGGQQVVFLTFARSGDKDPRKVVYKPSSMRLDAYLFGDDSVATMLDPTGNVISNYNIIPIDNAKGEDQKYGYMQFVEAGSPSNAADLLGVYRSIAGNMALAYLIGLDDIHKENVILLKDRVQVIDMEATTGVFKKGANKHVGAFISQQWNSSISEIGNKLYGLVDAKTLTDAPETSAAEDAMKTEFAAILARARSKAVDKDWKENKKALAKVETRIVPIATETFYNFVSLVKDKSYKEWSDFLNDPSTGPNVLNQARGLTSNSDAVLKRILLSNGTFNALKRGDIPYYTRDLGSNTIKDEEGNAIDATGHVKVGQPIDVEMDARRKEDKDEIKTIFEAQGVKWVANINDQLRQRIQVYRAQNPANDD